VEELNTIKTVFTQSTAIEIVDKIRTTGTSDNINVLVEWADETKDSVESFDIETVENQIGLFHKIIKSMSVNNYR